LIYDVGISTRPIISSTQNKKFSSSDLPRAILNLSSDLPKPIQGNDQLLNLILDVYSAIYDNNPNKSLNYIMENIKSINREINNFSSDIISNYKCLEILSNWGQTMAKKAKTAKFDPPYNIYEGFSVLNKNFSCVSIWNRPSHTKEKMKDPELLEKYCCAFTKAYDCINSKAPRYDYRDVYQSICNLPKDFDDNTLNNIFALFERAIDLDIEHAERFISVNGSLGLLDEIIKNRSILDHNNNKPIALVILPKSDHNGAFMHQDVRERTVNTENLIELGGNYKIIVHEAKNEDELYGQIKETSDIYGRIPLVVFGGHGCQIGLELSESGVPGDYKTNFVKRSDKTFLDIYDTEIKKYAGCLTEDAQIILISCLTGEGGKKAKNLANALQKAFPGRKIFAPEVATTLEHFVFDANGRIINVVYECGPEKTYITQTSK